MKRTARRTVAALLAATAMLAIAALSRVPYAASDEDRAVVRLSWRVRGQQVEECRRLSEEEMERLPIHMRRSEVCEGRVLPYHLYVELDGRPLADDTVHAAGAREDRPVYVYREIPVAPGRHDLSVRFTREDRRAGAPPVRGRGEDRDDDEEDEEMEDDHGDRPLTPPRLELSESLDLRGGDVVLVTYDPDRRALVTRFPRAGRGEQP